MNRLENKVALITQGNAGIGYAAAKEFLAEGATVIITARNKKKLYEAVKSLGSGAQGILSDAAEVNDIKSLPDKVREVSDTVDVIFLNAVYSNVETFEHYSEGDFHVMHQEYDEGVS